MVSCNPEAVGYTPAARRSNEGETSGSKSYFVPNLGDLHLCSRTFIHSQASPILQQSVNS